MKMRSIAGLGISVAVIAGATVLAPVTAMASSSLECEQGGQTGQRNIYYYLCDDPVAGASNYVWAGAPIVSGQGTERIEGTCIGGSLPYTIRVSYVVNGVTENDATGLTCSSNPKY